MHYGLNISTPRGMCPLGVTTVTKMSPHLENFYLNVAPIVHGRYVRYRLVSCTVATVRARSVFDADSGKWREVNVSRDTCIRKGSRSDKVVVLRREG